MSDGTPREHSNNSEHREADERWLSIQAACKLLGVDQSTLRRWSDSGRIPVFRTPGGHRRYREADLQRLLHGVQRSPRKMSRNVLTRMSISAYEPDYLRLAQQRRHATESHAISRRNASMSRKPSAVPAWTRTERKVSSAAGTSSKARSHCGSTPAPTSGHSTHKSVAPP